jgi:hypothetical protein
MLARVDGAVTARGEGPAIDDRPETKIGASRAVTLTILAVVVCVDLALQLMNLAALWSGYAALGILPGRVIGVFAGLVTLLVPAAFVIRSPDAWRVRRVLLVGMLLGAASELCFSADAAIGGVSSWILRSGPDSIWFQVMSVAGNLVQLANLAGVVGMLLVAFGLARLRKRSASPSVDRFLAIGLAAIGILGLAGLRLFVLPPLGTVTDQMRLSAALYVAGILAALWRAWVILSGWSAGEAPRRAWMLAGASTCVVLVNLALYGLANLLTADLFSHFDALVSGLGLAGGLLFVAAVADGLGASPARE